MPFYRFWKTIVGTLLLTTAIGHEAAAQQRGFSSNDLSVVMTAYVETAIDMHAIYETCIPADRRPGMWEEGAELLIASARASGLNVVVAAGLEARLAAPMLAPKIDCANDQAKFYSSVPPADDWPAYHRDVLGSNGIKIVEPAVQDARLEAVRKVVDEALPKQKRILVCISLFDPRNFLAVYSDWNGLVAQAAQAFLTAGFDTKDYAPMLDGAQSRNLYAPPTERVAAAADCMAEQEWLDRFSSFAWYSFASEVEAALKPGQP